MEELANLEEEKVIRFTGVVAVMFCKVMAVR